MNELEGFVNLLHRGEFEKATELATREPRTERWLGSALYFASFETAEKLLISGVRPIGTIYFEAVQWENFRVLQWMLQNKVGNKDHRCGPRTRTQTALDYAWYSKRSLIARLMMEYDCDCDISSTKIAIRDWNLRRSQIRTLCAKIITSPIGHKHTNVIIARIVWGMRLFV